jgi:hypothetical protein
VWKILKHENNFKWKGWKSLMDTIWRNGFDCNLKRKTPPTHSQLQLTIRCLALTSSIMYLLFFPKWQKSSSETFHLHQKLKNLFFLHWDLWLTLYTCQDIKHRKYFIARHYMFSERRKCVFCVEDLRKLSDCRVYSSRLKLNFQLLTCDDFQ